MVERRKVSVECVRYALFKGSSLLILEMITLNTYFCSAPRNEGGKKFYPPLANFALANSGYKRNRFQKMQNSGHVRCRIRYKKKFTIHRETGDLKLGSQILQKCS